MTGPKSMDINLYQQLAFRSAGRRDNDKQITNAILGLCGESGELADLYKKQQFHDHPFNKDKMVDELGDILWYVALLATALEVPLSEVAQHNIDKLMRRYPEGFDSERSINRPAE